MATSICPNDLASSLFSAFAAMKRRAKGVHERDIRDLLGHMSVRMTSVYTHQTPANLCHAVNTLTQTKLGKVVRLKRRSERRSSNPSAIAHGTDLMTRRSRTPKITKRRQAAALQKIAPSSRHRGSQAVTLENHEDVSVRQLATYLVLPQGFEPRTNRL